MAKETTATQFAAYIWLLNSFSLKNILNESGSVADRILDLNITSDKFRLPKGFDGGALFADRYGVSMNEGPKQTVRIKIDASQIKYFMTLPLHSSQKIVESNDEFSIVEFNLVPTYELKQELRKYGPDVEILAPEWLRQEFLNDAKRVVLYCL